jgi:hypothetical protein
MFSASARDLGDLPLVPSYRDAILLALKANLAGGPGYSCHVQRSPKAAMGAASLSHSDRPSEFEGLGTSYESEGPEPPTIHSLETISHGFSTELQVTS